MNAIVTIQPAEPVFTPIDGHHAFDGTDVRFYQGPDGGRWVVAPDVAKALGYRTAGDMTRSLDEDEKGTHSVRTLGGRQTVRLISEAGLYRVLVSRRAMKALSAETRERIARFQRWVFHDVLPTIARTGSYNPVPAPATAFAQADLLNPDVLLPLLTAYAQGNVALKAELVIERRAHGATTSALADAHVRADADRPKVIAQERQALADGELGLSETAVALGVDRIRVVEHLLQLGFLVRGFDGRCRSTREGRRSGLVRQTIGTTERMDGTDLLRGSVVVTAAGFAYLSEYFCRGSGGAGQPALPGL